MNVKMCPKFGRIMRRMYRGESTLSLKMEGEKHTKNRVFLRDSTFLVQRQNEGP